MKKAIFIAVCAVALVGLTAANRSRTITPSGKTVTEERAVAHFTAISTAMGIDVYLTQGTSQRVIVKTDERAMEYVVTEVKGEKISIRYASNVSMNRIRTQVYITVPEITELKASSAGDIIAKSDLRVDNLELSASSSGDIKLGKVVANYVSASASSSGDISVIVECTRISASASSGGDVTLSGKARIATLSASSGGDINAKNLHCVEVTAQASSGGDITCQATDRLTAGASSGSDIIYYGSPRVREVSRSSGGSVKGR